MLKILLISLGLLSFTISPATEIYKWVDENDQVHYGSRPKDDKAKQMNIKVPESTGTPSVTHQQRMDKQRRLIQSFEAEARSQRDKEEKEKKQLAKRKRACFEARDDYKRYSTAGGLYTLDDKGKRKSMTDAEFKAAVTKTKRRMQQLCEDID